MRLDEHQRLAAESNPLEDLMIVAGPGSGKTRILAARVAHIVGSGAFPGHQVVAITYTRSMAKDLSRRIEEALPSDIDCPACFGFGTVDADGRTAKCAECGGRGKIEVSLPSVGTLHSTAARMARRAMKDEIHGKDAILALGLCGSADFGIALQEDVDDLIDAAYLAARKKVKKRDLKEGLNLFGRALASWPPETWARQELVRRNLVTYDDLLLFLFEICKSGRSTMRDEFPCLIIDEAQDLSPFHWRIIDAWNPKSLTAVGDDGQEIFGFLSRRRKEKDDWLGFGGRVGQTPMGGGNVVRLGRNFRSTPKIVEFSHRLRQAMVADKFCVDVNLVPVLDPEFDAGASVVYANEEDDGGFVSSADAVQDLIDGGFDPDEIAVLGRKWDDLECVAAEAHSRGIPISLPERGRDRWRSISGRSFVALARHADRGFIDELDASTVLRLLGHPAPHKIISSCMQSALKGGRTLAEALDEHREASAGLPAKWWSEQAAAVTLGRLRELAEQAGFSAGPSFVSAADAACGWQGPGMPPGDWLVWLASDENSSPVEFVPGHVCVTTFHGAKGLEWPAVVVIGACDGSIPAAWDKAPEDVADSARCLYVGATRAKLALRVVVPRSLRGKPRNPTRWLVAAELATKNPAL